MPIYTFTCSKCDWQRDALVSMNTEEISCQDCGAPAPKHDVYAFAFSGFTSTPTDQITYHQEFKDMTEASAELEYKKERLEEAAGREIHVPSPAVAGMKRAKELRSKGVTSSEDWVSREKH